MAFLINDMFMCRFIVMQDLHKSGRMLMEKGLDGFRSIVLDSKAGSTCGHKNVHIIFFVTPCHDSTLNIQNIIADNVWNTDSPLIASLIGEDVAKDTARSIR